MSAAGRCRRPGAALAALLLAGAAAAGPPACPVPVADLPPGLEAEIAARGLRLVLAARYLADGIRPAEHGGIIPAGRVRRGAEAGVLVFFPSRAPCPPGEVPPGQTAVRLSGFAPAESAPADDLLAMLDGRPVSDAPLVLEKPGTLQRLALRRSDLEAAALCDRREAPGSCRMAVRAPQAGIRAEVAFAAERWADWERIAAMALGLLTLWSRVPR